MAKDADLLARLLLPLRQRIALMVRRALIDIVTDKNPVQAMQLNMFEGEVRHGVERMQEYGYSSVPPKGGQALVVFEDGECAHGVVVATDDRRYRPVNLKDGDLMLYTEANKAEGGGDTEHHIYFDKEKRAIVIRAKTIRAIADEDIDLIAGRNVAIAAGGDIDIIAGGNIDEDASRIDLN